MVSHISNWVQLVIKLQRCLVVLFTHKHKFSRCVSWLDSRTQHVNSRFMKLLFSLLPPPSLCPQISIVSTDDDLSWSSWVLSLFFLPTASAAWTLLVPMPTLVYSSSSSPYSTTTCLLKCIMSHSVKRMTAKRSHYVKIILNFDNYFYSEHIKFSVSFLFFFLRKKKLST